MTSATYSQCVEAATHAKATALKSGPIGSIPSTLGYRLFSVDELSSRAFFLIFRNVSDYPKGLPMNLQNLEAWLRTLHLTPEQELIAGLARTLAVSFDESGNTSTAAELRKTILELRRMVTAAEEAIDPLEQLLTRND